MNIDKIMEVWTSVYASAAQSEGWDLFVTDTDISTEVQVQRIDDSEELPYHAPYLSSDDKAMYIVRTGIGQHHEVARTIIKNNFPLEWSLIESINN